MWVKKALGRGVGAHNAYWVWLVNIIDASIYPQLVVEYVRKAFHLTHGSEAIICISMVVAVSFVSVMGVQVGLHRGSAPLLSAPLAPRLRLRAVAVDRALAVRHVHRDDGALPAAHVPV